MYCKYTILSCLLGELGGCTPSQSEQCIYWGDVKYKFRAIGKVILNK